MEKFRAFIPQLYAVHYVPFLPVQLFVVKESCHLILHYPSQVSLGIEKKTSIF